MTIKRMPLEANGHVLSRSGEVEAKWLFDDMDPMVSGAEYACRVCNQPPTYRFTDDAVHVVEPCPYPDGITTTVTIAVPSGKLLVSDDLRPVFTWVDADPMSYESTLGKADAIRQMADAGCAFGPADNCGLGLYRTGPDTYIIASPRLDEDDEPSLPESDCLARICTDLWAYACADFELWKARGGDPATLGWSDTVVDVPPGEYRFVHHAGERGFDRDSADTVVFAHVERV
ncbi:hypothetical protein ACIPJN_28975 [Streptomyces sp. NPDC086796]|uniref:hypothetical protein n=1 Tax=Streptomyces sp. NPDC086796 TaxID=3365760 RepID=UPI003826B2AA